ncbi:MAG: phosphotransferase [Terracidiphilus sp.]|jgi:hypothetical protein
MDLVDQLAQHDQYRIALFLPRSKKLLTELRNGSPRLPRINVPRWTRVAEQLTNAIRDKWRLRSSIMIDVLPSSQQTPACAVIEVFPDESKPLAEGLIPLPLADLADSEVTAAEHTIMQKFLTGETTGCGPFSRLGWTEEAQEWIRLSAPRRAIEFSGDRQGSSAGGSSALVRFGTRRPPAYWLKANGTPGANEYRVSTTLAQLFPDYLPPLVAAREDWNAWIMEDAGRPLEETFTLPAIEQATHSLAQLQIASVDHLDALLAAGCFDQRMPILRASIPKLIQYLEDAMMRQTSTRVAPIESKRLRELGNLLEEACGCMEILGIPDTLIHNDVNAGNILFDGSRAVFTDWAEAYIGNPFFTFYHLRAHAVQADVSHTWASKIKAIYANHWRCILSASQVARALTLCPPLAIASYLCGQDTFFELPSRKDLRAQSYARSLARHMDRAAQAPEFLEALCN